MTVSFSLTRKFLKEDYVEIIGVLTMDNSYPTGGETLDLSEYFSGTPVVDVCSRNALYGVYHNGGTAAAGKVLAWLLADGSEAGSTSDLSTVTAGLRATGPGY